MLFITNRVFEEGPTPISSEGEALLPRAVRFNLQNNQAEQSVYLCRRNGSYDYTEIGSAAFFQELRNANADQLLFFLHGFNTLPEQSLFQQAQALQDLFTNHADTSVLVIPLIWPCDADEGIVDDYFDDQKAADASGFAYMRLIEKFFKWRETNSTLEIPCTKHINILAHSMGNRVLRESLKLTHRYYQQGGLPLLFRNTFMVAADIVNESLEFGAEGQSIAESSRNVVTYFAADDLALRASKVANVGNSIASRRLGHSGPERMEKTPHNVYAIDCNDFNTQYDRPTGHTYFMTNARREPGTVFQHIVQCIQTGRVPNSETGRRQHILTDD
ncbi:MAG: alpha/beta hydrolase [Leptolyngbya sp. SIO1E4]|nr:alpha/beta hydrolase [Leptolyngbya sp. SIO1E4]